MAQVQGPIPFCRLFAFLLQQQKLMYPGLTGKNLKLSIKFMTKIGIKIAGESVVYSETTW